MKQNGVVYWPAPALLFLIFQLEYLISGPKSYQDFREIGRWITHRASSTTSPHRVVLFEAA